MSSQSIQAGIKHFAATEGAELEAIEPPMYSLRFPGDDITVLIGVELFGFAFSYNTELGALPDPSVAPTLLMENWCGFDGTCFYLSVNIEDGNALLCLQTRQLLDANATPESVAKLLSLCRRQWIQAKDGLEKLMRGPEQTQAGQCILCGVKPEMDRVPPSVVMMVYKADTPLICRPCVDQKGISREKVGPQEWIWFEGEKFLSYEDVFVLI